MLQRAQFIVPAMMQQSTKEWLRAIARHLNLSPSDLALKSGLAASTLTRYLNDRSSTIGISQRTLDAVAAYAGIAVNVMPGQRRAAGGMAEPDAVPYDTDDQPKPLWLQRAIADMRAETNALDPWVMKGWGLDMVGVMPGDVLMIDMNARPRAGDIVCAQIVDWATGAAETVIRRFDPPYLTAHSAKLGPLKPELIDDDRVSVRGIAIARIGVRH